MTNATYFLTAALTLLLLATGVAPAQAGENAAGIPGVPQETCIFKGATFTRGAQAIMGQKAFLCTDKGSWDVVPGAKDVCLYGGDVYSEGAVFVTGGRTIQCHNGSWLLQ